MKFEKLKDNLKERVFPGYIVAGEDAYLRAAAETMIKNRAVTGFPEMNVNYLDAETPAQTMIDCFNTLPLMSRYKFVAVRGFEPDEEAKQALLQYFKNPNPDAVVVFTGKSDFLIKLPGVYPGVCAYVDCGHLDTATLKKWLTRELAAAGVTLENSAADLLCDYCGFDMARLSSEAPKLAACGTSPVTETEIKNLVVPDISYQIYELSNSISDKNADKALAVLQSLLRKNDAPGSLFAAVYNHFRRMFYIAVTPGSDATLAQKLGVKEFFVTKTRQSLSAYRPARLKKILDILYNAETWVKTGKMKDIDALYYTVLKIV